MFNSLLDIANFMIAAFWEVWPYLLITIPLAVAVQMSGASAHISRAFQASPLVAIVLATAVGAFSPFCSCSVIPIVAALLIGGVPLAPVMAFWIASPSMDPEIFFLSVATIGWNLAIWRLGATLLLSLTAGFITHIVVQQGWLGQAILRSRQPTSVPNTWAILKNGWQQVRSFLTPTPVLGFAAAGQSATPATKTDCCETPTITPVDDWLQPAETSTGCGCNGSPSTETEAATSCAVQPAPFRERLLKETGAATLMVVKFMALAYFLEALIILYVPEAWITGSLGGQNSLAILWAALLGVPVYTTNLTALPLIGGLLAQGMTPGAALAFLIAGPTTTLPAMAAVWGLVTRRVFALYVTFSLVGAIVIGYVHALIFIN